MGGNRSTRRKPPTTSFRKSHILKPENSSPSRDSNPHLNIGGSRLPGKQTIAQHVTTTVGTVDSARGEREREEGGGIFMYQLPFRYYGFWQ